MTTYRQPRMRNVHDTLMLPTPGCRLSKSWFLASTRKLESLIPFLSEEDADKVCEELNDREEAQVFQTERDQLDYAWNHPIEY